VSPLQYLLLDKSKTEKEINREKNPPDCFFFQKKELGHMSAKVTQTVKDWKK